jgi:AraC family transcriptional activator of pobA
MTKPAINLPVKDKSENSRFLKATAFRKNTRKTEPHKHNSYFEIIYLSAGKGYHVIDDRRYSVNPPTLFFVRQEQVHHWDLDMETEPDGFVLILKKGFFEQSLDGELKRLLAALSKQSCVHLDDNLTIRQLFELLERESGDSFPFAEGLLKALFAKIIQAARPLVERSRQTDLYQAFTELLVNDAPIRNEVAYYADLLNTTPQNLNAVCRKAVDRSAAKVLAGYIIDEAKRLLSYTDNTISEISFSLSFKDPSHFVKYFKRHTALTPQGFRYMQA